jgi:hypothetical protein
MAQCQQREIHMNRIAATALLAATALISAASGAAQSSTIEVNVPFSFAVNNSLLPAGSYTFGFDSMVPDLLVVRDRTNGIKARDLGQRGSMGQGKPRSLIFHRYGNRYFLREVRLASASNGIFLPETKSEQRARKVSRQEDVEALAAAGELRSEEEVFLGKDRARSRMWCGWYGNSVACSIYRAG